MRAALLTTAQAAERLGVKASTVYAYVSRGLLTPVKEAGRRGSRFSPVEIESLRHDRPTTQGLVVESSITLIEDGRFAYRGHDALDLAARLPFERVAAVIWADSLLPTPWGRDDDAVRTARAALAALPGDAGLLHRIQMMVLALGASDPLDAAVRPESVVASGRRLISTVVQALAEDAEPTTAATPQTVASALALALGRTGSEPCLDEALGLIADHGLAASTTAVRLAAGFGASPAQCVLAGLAALSGPLHGGASGATQRLLLAALDTSLDVALRDALSTGTIPGFGQSLYPGGDPRFEALRDALSRSAARGDVVDLLDGLRSLGRSRGWGHPNVDMGLGAVAVGHGLRTGAGEAIFAIGRMAGWIAHAGEALGTDRIRPRARYVGVRPG